MTVEQSMSGQHDCGADAAAYVLGALEPAEAEAFTRHLATCVVCRDEECLYEFLTARVGALSGVERVETAPIIRTVKQASPVALRP